jgi:lipopolysaccharide export system permease protein
LTRFAERQLELPEVPRDFLTLETIPEELDWLELHDYAQKLRRQGYDSTQYRVDLQMRLALPVTSVILALLGVSIALRQGPRGGIAFGVGVGLVVACLYLAIFQLGSSLATAALLPPILGVWSGNILFAVLGLYLLKTAPQ